MNIRHPPNEFALYVDDIGSGKPGTSDQFPYFGMGGILVRRHEEMDVKQRLRDFKNLWAIGRDVPMHGAEIRSKKDNFHFLKDWETEKLLQFKNGLVTLLASMPIIVHGCVVDRAGYLKRYQNKYGRKTWEMRKSAVSILVERSAKYVAQFADANLTVFFEMSGKSEDQIVRDSYSDLRNSGHPFDQKSAQKYNPPPQQAMEAVLAIEPFFRRKDSELLQIADLCLFPLATMRNGKENLAYQMFNDKNKLIDKLVGDKVNELGVKYYCFD